MTDRNFDVIGYLLRGLLRRELPSHVSMHHLGLMSALCGGM